MGIVGCPGGYPHSEGLGHGESNPASGDVIITGFSHGIASDEGYFGYTFLRNTGSVAHTVTLYEVCLLDADPAQ